MKWHYVTFTIGYCTGHAWTKPECHLAFDKHCRYFAAGWDSWRLVRMGFHFSNLEIYLLMVLVGFALFHDCNSRMIKNNCVTCCQRSPGWFVAVKLFTVLFQRSSHESSPGRVEPEGSILRRTRSHHSTDPEDPTPFSWIGKIPNSKLGWLSIESAVQTAQAKIVENVTPVRIYANLWSCCKAAESNHSKKRPVVLRQSPLWIVPLPSVNL